MLTRLFLPSPIRCQMLAGLRHQEPVRMQFPTALQPPEPEVLPGMVPRRGSHAWWNRILAVALWNLNATVYFGITDHWDESVCLFHKVRLSGWGG